MKQETKNKYFSLRDRIFTLIIVHPSRKINNELGCLEVTEDVLEDADDQEDDLDLYEALMKILKVGKNAARVISLQNIFHHDAHDLISC